MDILLTKKKKLSIDVDNNFKPTYKVTSDKKDVVKMLKESSSGKNVIFAADDDRKEKLKHGIPPLYSNLN